MLKLLTMAASITFMQVKNLLKQKLVLVNAKLEELSNKLNELDSTVIVKFLNNRRTIETDKKHNVSAFLKKIICFPLSEQQ